MRLGTSHGGTLAHDSAGRGTATTFLVGVRTATALGPHPT